MEAAKLSVASSDIGKVGDGGANLLEQTGVLSIPAFTAAAWKRESIDYTELASKRSVERLTLDQIATEMGWSRTTVVRHLGIIRNVSH